MGFSLVIVTFLGALSLKFFLNSKDFTMLLILIALLGAGYYKFSYKPAAEAAAQSQGN